MVSPSTERSSLLQLPSQYVPVLKARWLHASHHSLFSLRAAGSKDEARTTIRLIAQRLQDAVERDVQIGRRRFPPSAPAVPNAIAAVTGKMYQSSPPTGRTRPGARSASA